MCVSVSLQRQHKWRICLLASTTFALLFWQFSSFVLTTQGAALLATYILGLPIRSLVKEMCGIHLLAIGFALGLQLVPRLLLMSVYLHMNIAIMFVMCMSERLSSRIKKHESVPSPVIRVSEGAAAVCVWLLIRFGFSQ